MKTHHHPATFVHLINQMGLLGICVALVCSNFYYQLVRRKAALCQFAYYYSGLASSSPVLAFYLTSALVYEAYITGW